MPKTQYLQVDRPFQDMEGRRYAGELIDPAEYGERLLRQFTEQHRWHLVDERDLDQPHNCKHGRKWASRAAATCCPIEVAATATEDDASEREPATAGSAR